MEIRQAMQARHSVRRYTGKKIENKTVVALQAEIDACNAEGGVHMQLITEEPKAFGNFLVHYGLFRQVTNYIALIGKDGKDLEEKLGYYGERVVLFAQTLGLNTCWVAATFGKGAAKKSCQIGEGEKLVCVIALGYGEAQGTPHKSKPMQSLCATGGNVPDWFQAGMEAALLAPTAVNQQKFLFTLSGDTIKAESTGGRYAKVDLGIVKYHFEVGAGKEHFRWA